MGASQSQIPPGDQSIIAKQADLIASQEELARVQISRWLGDAAKAARIGPWIFYILLTIAAGIISFITIANSVDYSNKQLNCTASAVTLDLNCRPIRLNDCNYCPAQEEMRDLVTSIGNPALRFQGAASNINNSAVVQPGFEGTKGGIINVLDIATRTANAYGAEFIITATAVTDYPIDVYDVTNPRQVCLGAYIGQTVAGMTQTISAPVSTGWLARYASDHNYLLYVNTKKGAPELPLSNPGLSLQITRPTVFSLIAMIDMQFCARYAAVNAPGAGGPPADFGPCTTAQPSQEYFSFCCNFTVDVGQHTYVCSKQPPLDVATKTLQDDHNVIVGNYEEKASNPTEFPSSLVLSSVDVIGWVTRIQSDGPIDPDFQESVYLSVGSDAHGIVTDFYLGAPAITIEKGAAVRTAPIEL